MSTNSFICIKTESNQFKCIYCHYDGEPEFNGKILVQHYNSLEKAESLLALGDASCIDKSIEKPDGHSFNNRIDGYSVFYHRDRGEDKDTTKAQIYDNFNDLGYNDYTYVFENNQWKCYKNNTQTLEEIDLSEYRN
jgi:hypothetical protein